MARVGLTWDGQPDVPYGYCKCGCGEKTTISATTHRKRGYVCGEPVDFRLGHHMRLRNTTPEYVVDEATGCWVWQRAKDEDGYGRRRDSTARTRSAHRSYYEQYVGPIPEGLQLHHVCENRACVNPEHLQPLTPLAHRWISSPTKLTPEIARGIKDMRESGLTMRQVGDLFGVTRDNVKSIWRGIAWREA